VYIAVYVLSDVRQQPGICRSSLCNTLIAKMKPVSQQ
jgi:hypothetical protein